MPVFDDHGWVHATDRRRCLPGVAPRFVPVALLRGSLRSRLRREDAVASLRHPRLAPRVAPLPVATRARSLRSLDLADDILVRGSLAVELGDDLVQPLGVVDVGQALVGGRRLGVDAE